MKNLAIQETERTPKVILDLKKETFIISGESFPEDVATFYGPVILAVNELPSNFNGKLNVEISLIYTNSSSIKALYRIFEGLDNFRKVDKELNVNWNYQDDDDIMEELGEDFKDRFPEMKINLVSI